MKHLKYYLQKAQAEKWAIGQFNFSTFEQVKGIVAAAQRLQAPIILGTSEGESKFVGLEEAVFIRNMMRKRTGVPIFLNLDHGKSFDYLKEAAMAGYDMIHFDGSHLPIKDNTMITKHVTTFARWRRVLVEGEVGRFPTDASRLYQEQFRINEEDLTKPDQAREYVKATAVDLVAVSVGTFHGMEAKGHDPHIRLDWLGAIQNGVSIPLVLHGGSGTPDEDIKKAMQRGIAKININTETRLAFTNGLRKALEADIHEIVPYKYLPSAISAIQEVTERNIKLFGSENRV